MANSILAQIPCDLNAARRCMTILCLTSRTTVTSARIPEEDACIRTRNLCVPHAFKKEHRDLTHKGCVLQRVSLGALSDVTVVLGMRQSIETVNTSSLILTISIQLLATYWHFISDSNYRSIPTCHR